MRPASSGRRDSFVASRQKINPPQPTEFSDSVTSNEVAAFFRFVGSKSDDAASIGIQSSGEMRLVTTNVSQQEQLHGGNEFGSFASPLATRGGLCWDDLAAHLSHVFARRLTIPA
jgi:hypothetical protein